MLHYFTDFIINVFRGKIILQFIFWEKKTYFNDLLVSEMYLLRRRNMGD